LIKTVLQSIANGYSSVYVGNNQDELQSLLTLTENIIIVYEIDRVRLSWDVSDVSSVTKKLLESSSHCSIPKLQQYQEKDFENRTKLKNAVKRYPNDEEKVLQLHLVDSQLLENFPYLVLWEWDVVPDRSDLGKGDLVFTNGCGVYAVIETKYINRNARGKTGRSRRTNNRKVVIKQANKYRSYVPNFFDDVMMVYGATYTNEDSLKWIFGDVYNSNWKKIILCSMDGVKSARVKIILKSSRSSRASLPTSGHNSYPNSDRKYHQEDLYKSHGLSSPRANQSPTNYHHDVPHRGHTSSVSNSGRQKYRQGDLYESCGSSLSRANRSPTTYHHDVPHHDHTSSVSNGYRQKYRQEVLYDSHGSGSFSPCANQSTYHHDVPNSGRQKYPQEEEVSQKDTRKDSDEGCILL